MTKKLTREKRLKIQEWARLHTLRSMLMDKNFTALDLQGLPKLREEVDKRIEEVTPYAL